MSRRLLYPYSPKNLELSKLANLPSGFLLNLYREAGEASGSFQSASRTPSRDPFAPAKDKTRAREEAARRARGKIRRYCAHNGLNRFGTLTYKGEGCHDPKQVRIHVAAFFKELRAATGGDLPYLWVPEWHATHGLHVHFAVGRYIKRSMIEAAWPHGFVHIKLIGDLPHGAQVRDEARIAARYLAKYVGKGFEDRENIGSLHRYDVAQGFKPKPIRLFAPTSAEVMREAVRLMGGPTQYFWSSNEDPTWGGATALYLSW